MGRRGGRGGRGGGRGGGGGGGGWKSQQGGRGNWSSNQDNFVQAKDKDNADFTEYYQAQGVVPEGEWGAFLDCLRTPLPVTFRINGKGTFADHLRDKLQSDFFSHFQNEVLMVDDEPLQPPRALPWYPNNYAWQLNFSRNQLRKLPLLSDIHEFMKKANEIGSISRQEAVSMVPPLFLDVQAHHKVLDMCAAPGSKTFQLLEGVHSNPSNPPVTSDPSIPMSDVLPSGLVVANDADVKRCQLLTHNLKRVCSPCLLIVNHSADVFPLLQSPDGKGLRFDRILCDVPCSGDGTMRKAPDIWRRWNVGNGNGLHILQLRIALRGIQLLEVGGRMVYSTCTFNPIEDEAVVAEILKRCGSAVKLCDVSDQLPALKRLPGKHTWKVRDKYKWYDSWEKAKNVSHKLEPSMFPTADTAKLPLERCMRFLPHHQDTGGFFVAVLEKVAELPADFQLPTTFRAADQGTGFMPDRDYLEDVRLSAEAALAAAESAVTALAAGDTAGVSSGRGAALRASQQASKSAASARAAAKRKRDDAEQGGAEEEGGAADMAVDKEEAEEGGEAVQWEPSWVRGGPGKKGKQAGGFRTSMDPVVPAEEPTMLKAIQEYYGMSSSFPVGTHLVTRTMDAAHPKRLYLVSDSVLKVLLMDTQDQLRIVSTGLKVFDRQEIKDYDGLAPSANPVTCRYRYAQEGLPYLLPYTTKQRVAVGLQDFLALLRDRVLIVPSANGAAAAEGKPDEAEVTAEGKADGKAAGEASKTKTKAKIGDPELLAAMGDIRFGCLVCELKPSDAQRLGLAPREPSSTEAYVPMALSAWRGKNSIAIMVDRAEIAHMVDKIEVAMSRLPAEAPAAQ